MANKLLANQFLNCRLVIPNVMSSGQSLTQKQRMALTTEMMIKGATLLREACPKCGGVQVKFQGHTYCTVEDDLENALSPEGASPAGEPEVKREASQETPKQRAEHSPARDGLRAMLEQKLAAASKELEATKDVAEQTKLLDLISKYVETLEKLKSS